MKESSRQWKRGMVGFLNDLPLLVSLCIAQFIVWRVLHRRRKENSARRSEFKLLRGEGFSAHAGQHLVGGFDWRAEAIGNSAGGSIPEK